MGLVFGDELADPLDEALTAGFVYIGEQLSRLTEEEGHLCLLGSQLVDNRGVGQRYAGFGEVEDVLRLIANPLHFFQQEHETEDRPDVIGPLNAHVDYQLRPQILFGLVYSVIGGADVVGDTFVGVAGE